MAKTSIDNEKIEIYARDLRMVRGAKEVLKHYKIARIETDAAAPVSFRVSGGLQPYTVILDPDWRQRPSCTCPDASKRALDHNGGYCKHIIAVLLSEPAFRCQLLEIFL
ncbi:MAG: SWIM zinc finger family protein [Candidatus Riflebacteria bacterium]